LPLAAVSSASASFWSLSVVNRKLTESGAKCYGWAGWFLGMAALQLLGGYMDITVASSERRPPAKPPERVSGE
jgi:hypothetical protein